MVVFLNKFVAMEDFWTQIFDQVWLTNGFKNNIDVSEITLRNFDCFYKKQFLNNLSVGI